LSTIEQLRIKHPSRRRNERIAQVFHARKYIDRFGGGTRRILRLCAEHGLPEPIFSEEGDGFQVKFIFKEPIGTQQNVVMPGYNLTPRQIEIISILEVFGGLTTKALSEKLSYSLSERRLRDQLNLLNEQGLIRPEGSTSNRRWILIKK
jgi:ATP-dependent DNA helicase RecG